MTSTDTDLDERAGYVDGLRRLADLLAANPVLPLPWNDDITPVTLFTRRGTDQKAVAAAFARAVGGVVAKRPRGDYLDLIGRVGALRVELVADRDAVCERIVVGVETVTVPARPAVEATPEQVVEREVVEWVCGPLLAAAADSTAAAS